MASPQLRKRAARAKAARPGAYDRQLSGDERRAEQRNRLLLAAIEVFASEGYAKASVDAIVERARMSRRTFYEHFSDLSDALLQVFEFGSGYLYRSVQEAIAGRTDPVEQVTAGIYAYLEVFKQNSDIARVLHREIRAVGPKQASRYELAVLRFANLISQGVTEAYARGIAGRAPDETTIYALIGGIEAVGMRYVDRGEADRILEAAPLLVELVVRAFR